MREAREATSDDPERSMLPTATAWCTVLCAAVAIGYSLWAAHGSGHLVASIQVAGQGAGVPPSTNGAACPSFGPVPLSPAMNPLRAVLHTEYAPFGATRLRYEIALSGSDGPTLWDERGVLGSESDDAPTVIATHRLLDFEIPEQGEYSLQASFPGTSLDDLREASLEIRGNVAHADPRITWGFGLASAASLIAYLLSSRRESHPATEALDERRDAA